MFNVMILCLASLLVGFIVGVVVAGPRRWETFICDPDARDHPHPAEPLAGAFDGGVSGSISTRPPTHATR